MKTICEAFHANVARASVALAVLSGASSVVGATKVADFEVREGEARMRLSDVRGRFAVIQVLPGLESPDVTDYVQGFMRRRNALADLVPIFVCRASEESVTAFRAGQSSVSKGLRVYADTDGNIAKGLGLTNDSADVGPVPVTIIVDPAGDEVVRRVGKSPGDFMPIQEVFAYVDSHTAAPDLAQFNLIQGDPALKGYDPVEYFESGSAKKGRAEWTTRFRGVNYQFVGESNLAKFVAEPELFRPTYGGWCATAMADGRKVDIDPTNFKVSQGRLFLFYKGWLGNARTDWDKKEVELMRLADEHWRKIAPSDHPRKETNQ